MLYVHSLQSGLALPVKTRMNCSPWEQYLVFEMAYKSSCTAPLQCDGVISKKLESLANVLIYACSSVAAGDPFCQN